MTDVRLQRLADVLVNYSTCVKPGEWVGILGDVVTLPALRAVYESVLQAGGNPTLFISDENMAREFLREASAEQIAWLDPSQILYYDKADVYIRIGRGSNTRVMINIDPKRNQEVQAEGRTWMDSQLKRSAEGTFKWVGAWYPNESSAQEANMSLEEYEDFVYGATFADRENAVDEWRKVAAMQEQKIQWLKGKKAIKLQGPN